MKNSKLILLSLIFVFVFTACQLFSSGSAPATAVPATQAQAPVATSAAAVPYPQGSEVALPVISSGAYPYPGSAVTPLANDAYPDAGATVPPAAAQEAYPSPVAQSLVAQTEPVYPDLKDGAEVQWSQVQSIVFSGQVVRIGQTHDLNVYLTLKDGRTLKAVEPAIDDILKLVKACGTLCQGIKFATQ
jgi:hypothetical protein